MVSLRKYTHASTLPIHQIFLSTLRQLPNLNLINMCYGGAESFTSLIALAPKIVSLELQLYREGIKVPDCLEVSPRSLPSEDSSKPNGRPSVVKFRRSVIEGIAELLVKARDNLQVLYLDVPPWERVKTLGKIGGKSPFVNRKGFCNRSLYPPSKDSISRTLTSLRNS